jgi:hypothetical protein
VADIAPSILEKLKNVTGRSDWRPISGPETGHGVDHWFENDQGQVAYGNADQGHVVLMGEDDNILFEGELDAVQ